MSSPRKPAPARRATGIDAKIRSAIREAGPGAVFTPADFLALGSRAAVDKVLSRLAAEGKLRRIARGLYHLPKKHPRLGALAPDSDTIARALAGRHALKLLPSGEQAANLLRLSEQVPAKAVYLTNGPSRTFRIGKQEIILKHAAPRRLEAAGGSEGLVREALRYLGKPHVDEARVRHLRKLLPAAERAALLRDLPLAPAWMHPHLRYIAGDEGKAS